MEKTNQELRYALLQANQYNVENAKKCYDFVQGKLEGDTEPENKQEGIYLIYDDRAELFTGANAQNGVKYVGVIFQGHRFAVSLTETEEAALLPSGTKATKRPDCYKNECEAIYDFDSTENTAKLLQDNPRLADLLKEGETIPALGVLVIMRYLREGINKALEYAGGKPLSDNDYWSSTEGSEGYAWLVNFSNGLTWYINKYGGNAVRAVAAF